MKVLAVLPARWSSTRFPGKPLVPIAGVPMILRVWQRAKLARLVTDVVIATDDERIVRTCREAGAEVEVTRSDHATGTDRIHEVSERRAADIYVNVQGDEPIIDPAVIDAVVGCLQSALPRGIDVATAYLTDLPTERAHSPNCVKLVPRRDGCVMTFSRLPVPLAFNETMPYSLHIGLYAYTAAALKRFVSRARGPVERAESLEQMRFFEYGDQIACVPVTSPSIGVDVPEDVGKVEALIRAGAV